MKKNILVMALIVCSAITVFALNNLPAEEENIKQVVSDFIISIDNKDATLLESIILEEGTFVNVNLKNEVEALSSSELITRVKSGKMGGWKRDFEVSEIELDNNIAIAKVKINSPKVNQLHNFSLVKIGEQWKITGCCTNMTKS